MNKIKKLILDPAFLMAVTSLLPTSYRYETLGPVYYRDTIMK